MITLRDYQKDMIQQVKYLASEGCKRMGVYKATGGGKTVVMGSIVEGAINKGSPVDIIVHLDPLFNQTKQTLVNLGIPDNEIGFIKPGYKENDKGLIQIVSLQTAGRRPLVREREPRIRMFDEAHTTAWYKASLLWLEQPKNLNLLFTATPYRTSKKQSFQDVVDASVHGPTPPDLIKTGWLVPLKYYTTNFRPDLTKVRVVNGDWDSAQLSERCNTPVMIADAYKEWERHAYGKRTIAFCVDNEHAKALVAKFREQGIAAAHIYDKTPLKERQEMYKNLKSGLLTVLVSVNIITLGFDCPPVEVGLMCRPTKSISWFLQALGRVMRLSPETGKTHGIILDQAGNCLSSQLLLPEELTSFAEDEATLLKAKQMKKDCPSCHAIVNQFAQVCPECGHIFSDGRVKKSRRIKPTSLEELDIESRKALVKTASSSDQATHYAQLLGIAWQNKYSPGWIMIRFRIRFGSKAFPKKEWGLHAIFGARPSAEDKAKYLEHLKKKAEATNKKSTWVEYWFSQEFGEPSGENTDE